MSSGKVVDQSLLDDFVVERRALWKNFGSYENVSKSQAADLQGLFDNYELLQGLWVSRVLGAPPSAAS